LAGKVVAIVGSGSPLNRAIAMALASSGADVAVGTQASTQEQEFAVASIANEVWAIGREQFSHVMDAQAVDGVAGLIAESRRKLGRCDALVVIQEGAPVDTIQVTGIPTLYVGGAGENAVAVAGADDETAARVTERTASLLSETQGSA
jgi:NAD(P)-dependent dehydrogenase (short-subunit alcohol dehydrogenase family)